MILAPLLWRATRYSSPLLYVMLPVGVAGLVLAAIIIGALLFREKKKALYLVFAVLLVIVSLVAAYVVAAEINTIIWRGGYYFH